MRVRFLSVLLLAVFLLAACGGGDSEDPSDPQASEAAPEPAKPVLCPLTGLEAPGDFDQERPALAVKIDNAPPARPQAGIQQADIVYEEIGEGGLTRLLSIFQCSDADQLGPIRSARTVDPDILQEYSPVLFAYSGANGQVLKKVGSTSGLTDLQQGKNGDAYNRESSRKAPYNLFSSTSKIRGTSAAKDVKGAPKPGFEFDPSLLEAAAPPPAPPAAGAPPAAPAAPAAPAGNSVTFSYSNSNNVRFTYDPAKKAYLRFHGDTPHKAASGEQVSVVNVVVFKVKVTPGTVKDASGSPTQDTTVIGTGEATILRGGVAVTGKWNRAGVGSKTTLTDASGAPVKLAPGNTWIHLVPLDRPVTVQ